jgi:hypothetical protein
MVCRLAVIMLSFLPLSTHLLPQLILLSACLYTQQPLYTCCRLKCHPQLPLCVRLRACLRLSASPAAGHTRMHDAGKQMAAFVLLSLYH